MQIIYVLGFGFSYSYFEIITGWTYIMARFWSFSQVPIDKLFSGWKRVVFGFLNILYLSTWNIPKVLYKISCNQEDRVWFVKEYLPAILKYWIQLSGLYFLADICSTTPADKQLPIYCQQFVSKPATISLMWLKQQGLSTLGNDFRLSVLALYLFFNNADYLQHEVQGKHLWLLYETSRSPNHEQIFEKSSLAGIWEIKTK